MTLIVEDGSVVTNANSYVTTTELTNFATARSVTLTAGAETLLVQAMDYLESLAFKGIKLRYDQALQWPRSQVYIDGWYNNPSDIPQQLKDGQMHVAIAIDQGNGPDADIIRSVSSEKVGELEVKYANSSASATINIKLQNALYKLLDNGGSGSLKVSKA